nr:hypothetical protein [Tanacetum cinerariifolium]
YTYTFLPCYHRMSTLVFADPESTTQADRAQSSRVSIPLPEDPYEAIMKAYLEGTNTEFEPFEDPKTETVESSHIVAPPTCYVEESEGSGTFDARSMSSDSTVPLSPDHPLTHTTPVLVPILRRTARMVVHVSAVMSHGLSAGIAEVAAMPDSAFHDESYGLDDKSHGLDDESHGLEDDGLNLKSEGLGLGEEEAIPEGQQQGAQSSRVSVPLPKDPYEAIMQGYLEWTDTESEPFRNPLPEDLYESYGLDDESYGLDDESHGVDDENRGLDDDGRGLESDGLGLGEEDDCEYAFRTWVWVIEAPRVSVRG